MSYAARSTSVVVTMDRVFDDGGTGEGDNVANDLENADGGSEDDTMIGSASSNVLIGGGGDDTLDGAAGADTLDAGDDDDVLIGERATTRWSAVRGLIRATTAPRPQR